MGTHTPTNVVQYNEYYPFGLQASTSWTRNNSKNNFLYNQGGEINTTTGWYDLAYRNYDAALGRFMQVAPLAHRDASTSPFAYAGNNPVMFNDPLGLLKKQREILEERRDAGWYPDGWSYDSEGGGGGGFGGGGSTYSWTTSDPEKIANIIGALRNGTFKIHNNSFYYGYYVEYGASVAIDRDRNPIDGTERGYNIIYFGYEELKMIRNLVYGDGSRGFNFTYSEALDNTLSVAGGVAGAFETGAVVSTFQTIGKVSISTTKGGVKLYKGLGTAGIALTAAVVVHELATHHDNTHTWVDVGVTAAGWGATFFLGSAALPAVVVIGLGYGIWSYAGGSDWIDENWGYRDTNTFELK